MFYAMVRDKYETSGVVLPWKKCQTYSALVKTK